jgi:hypothetical protein
MIHEHQNPKNNNIEWNDKKVYQWAKITQGWDEKRTYENIIEKPSEQINGSSYDPESIMLYFFPAELTKNNKGTNQNLFWSPKDIIYLGIDVYPGERDVNKLYYKWYGKEIKDEISKEQINKKLIVDNQNSKYIFIIFFIIIFFIIIFYLILKKNKNTNYI